ncbi:MAG: hypothetical protein PVS2B1_11310 [Candidatus Dormibacteraceae bacterium]
MASENATSRFLNSLAGRRGFLKAGVGASAGLAAFGITNLPALAATTSVGEILNIAVTAEQLAVTFYSNGVARAKELGLRGASLDYIKAALIEEQIHLDFFATNGGVGLVNTFSFPDPDTFDDLNNFIATQQTLEGVFDAAFIAAVGDFYDLGQRGLAQIACQVAMIESEHRALGRAIVGLAPADNWAYGINSLKHVNDAPALVAAAGFFSPVSGNSYPYVRVSTDDPRIISRNPAPTY